MLNAAERDPNIIQDLPTSCAIKCEQLMMRDYGYDVSEQDLRTIAESHGWYDVNEGVRMNDNGKLLGCFGINYRHSQFNDLDTLKKEILRRHRVMVNVNRNKLLGIITPNDKNEACHAILVTAVDENDEFVKITDPANGDVNRKHNIHNFVKAWEDSLFYMLATEYAALYEYEPLSRTMIELH